MKSGSSLFSSEERTIARAQELLQGNTGSLPADAYADLLKQYRKLLRQSESLVKMGDRMQGQLNRLNEELVESEEKYRNIFETSIQGIYRSTPGGRFLDLNPAMAKIFGYESAREMLDSVTDIGKDIFLSQGQRRNFLHGLTRSGSLKDQNLRLRRRDGSLIWVEVCVTGVFSGDDELIELKGTVVDITEKHRMLMELKKLARCDSLTGLWNRGYFLELGKKEMARAKRQQGSLSMIYFDVDCFKGINDTYGHEVGDRVLQEIAEIGGRILREVDIFGRLGGEEFGILLPDTTEFGAVKVAERLRAGFESYKVIMPHVKVRFTASFGVARLSDDSVSLDALIKTADQALYTAKREGRNRVVSASACESKGLVSG